MQPATTGCALWWVLPSSCPARRTFDLVVSTTSFGYWVDQRVGLAQRARVLAPGGCLVLTDLFLALLLPTLLAGHRDMRGHSFVTTMLKAGFDLRDVQIAAKRARKDLTVTPTTSWRLHGL